MGKIWVFGDNISTDDIIPGRRNITSNEKELARYVFEYKRPEFSKRVLEGDIIIGGLNFGCGSSREHAPIAIRASGVRNLVAKSYATIFYRNCINVGLYPLILKEDIILEENTKGKICLDQSKIVLEDGKEYLLEEVPFFIQEIIDLGGLIPYLNEKNTYLI
jgi:3-isopropylmalate dehydratase small subunit